MTIPTGVYGIFTTTGTRVGRAAHEVHDVRPKPVFTNTDDHDPTWVVEKLPNGNYILCAQNAPTTALDGAVFALIIDQMRRTEWRVTFVHDDLFRVEDPMSGLLWTCLSYEKHSQVELRPPVLDEKIQLFRFLEVE